MEKGYKMSHKSLIVHVGGAHGVGKSLILKNMSNVVSSILPLTIVSVSTEVSRLGMERFGRSWNRLNSEERNLMRDIFISNLSQSKHGIRILDSHYVDVLDSGQVQDIIPKRLYAFIDYHIVVDCSSDVLAERRKLDTTRKGVLDKKVIGEERRGELVIGRKIAQETKKPFCVVSNSEGVDFAVGYIAGIVSTIWQM